ncbi:hypothetical protein RE080_004341 [Klebsiella pneumoniae]|uniref:DUF6685 family protein n=1 Tax=Klebsiella pneumoniae TaxID=573 RepID=UPI001ABD2160|nr:DUF6685 family protein [Klebsiella pneumoniae]EKZ6495181.1 hypothetical protein [Klebsiella pneumoniae]MBS4512112.1 hypothetical protein [Klebsiella pneumoniae]HDH0388303.1 hypothetical protein [Klebsiella pneumoniae]HEH1454381.1 hypothetical protein [Klebsiella pneumoniae]
MIDNGISSSTPLWRKILQACQDELLDSLGYPATLRRRLNNGALPVKLPLIEDTIWLRSVVCWHTWLNYEKNCIRYLRPGHDGDYDYLKLHIPQLAGLVSCEITENYLCDISEIGGMSCSRNSDRQCSSLEDFALQCCRELTIPVSGDHLDNNLSHSQLRLNEMEFSKFSWMPARIYWNNLGGSHHFAAARLQASQLGQRVPLTGRLTSYWINPQNVRLLTSKWDLFLISDNVVYGEFKDALARLKCPFGVSHPPRWEDGEEQRFRIIWLERNQTIPSRVSRTLAQAGFPSVGQLLLKPEP